MPLLRWDPSNSEYVDLRTGTPIVPSDPTYRPGFGTPVFRDEFSSDLSQWNVRNNFTTIDTARAMTANSTVESGQLHLRGKWLTTPESAGPQGILTHTTGYVDTRNLTDAANPSPEHFSQQYGRWEVRCKVPTGTNTRGALAAFWLRCDSTPGEIDIMEAWGGGGTMAADWTNYIKDSAVTTFHSSTSSATVNGKPYKKTMWRHWQHGVPKPLWSDFHVFAFEYMPTYIATFVDGIQVMRVTPASTDPMNGGTLAWLWDSDFFGSPMHMRMNLHVGPSAAYWGLPDPNNRQWTVDPLDFVIDYVYAYAPEDVPQARMFAQRSLDVDAFITDALPNSDAVWTCPVDGCEWAAYGDSVESSRSVINDHLSDHRMSLPEVV